MLAKTMHSAVARAVRAYARNFPAAKSLVASSAAPRALLVRRTFMVAPSYKARIAVRGYATATATATKKKTTLTKPRAAAASAKAKKPAAKKTPVKAKKPAAKKKKAVAAKKPVKKPVKKLPTKSSEAKRVLTIKRDLKKVALYAEGPKHLPSNRHLLFQSERLGSTGTKDRLEVMKQAAVEYRSLSDSEKSRLDQKALENKAINAANHKKWVESHTVADIVAANKARARLTRDFYPKGLAKKHLHKIADERAPKRPGSAFAQFMKTNLTGVSDNTGNRLRDLSAQWKSLSTSEKKPYSDLASAEMVRYMKEMDAAGLPRSEANVSA